MSPIPYCSLSICLIIVSVFSQLTREGRGSRRVGQQGISAFKLITYPEVSNFHLKLKTYFPSYDKKN